MWTDKGLLRHAKILNNDKAWEVYEELEDTYFKVKESQNKYPQLSKELQAIFTLDSRTMELDGRITKLENSTTIDYSQQEELRELANKKIEVGEIQKTSYLKLAKLYYDKY